jgi:protein TonB
MDRIIFEHRNQSYGAYQLRRQHARVLAWTAAVTLVVFVLGMILLFSRYTREPAKDREMWYFFDLGSSEALNRPKVNPVSPPPTGGFKIPQLAPQVTDSVAKVDTIINNADGNGTDTTGHGSGNGNGNGEGPVYYSAQQAPSFPGGEKERIRFMQQNIIYPPDAKKQKIRGSVYVAFIVETDGTISNVRLLQGIGHGCDEEALRVVNSMPRWTPGKQNGIPVRVHVVIPLVFTLN